MAQFIIGVLVGAGGSLYLYKKQQKVKEAVDKFLDKVSS